MADAGRAWIMGPAFAARMPHHDGIAALWETKWKLPCSKSVYPFHDGLLQDFAPVFEHLIAHKIDDGTSPAYTTAFFPVAEALVAQAEQLLTASGSKSESVLSEASSLLLRACCLYRIARFPYISAAHSRDDPKWTAWEAQKAAYLKAAQTWKVPICEVLVPHVYRREGEGASIPVYLRMPPSESPVPAVLLLTGLDGYRPDNTGRCDEFLARGWASIVVEIPGTADCPADATDPTASERLWDSLFAWIQGLPGIDPRRIAAWGLSAGGYHAVRMAHTHASKLAGVVAQGAGVHYFFGKDWLARADDHEYPFELLPALAAKHGFGSDAQGVAAYVAEAQKKFSLVVSGLVDQPSTKLLLVNGTHDGLMPIEDSLLLLEHGTPKTARFFAGALHMGYPLANGSVYPWMEGVLG